MPPLARALWGQWSEELLYETPPSLQAIDQTADGRHVVWIEDVGNGLVRTGWDGVSSEPFKLIPQRSGDPVAWSPDRNRVAWFGNRDGQMFVAVDGTEHPYEGISHKVSPTFSPDSRRVAYGATVDGKRRLIVDGKPFGDWGPAPLPPVFSPDGSRLAFVAENRRLEQGEDVTNYWQWVVLDGVPGPEVQSVSAAEPALQFSPDGRRFVYGLVVEPRVRLLLHGVHAEARQNLAYATFSPDSSRLVYVTIENDQSLVGGAVQGPRVSSWRTGPPVFSPDSTRLAYIAVDSRDRARAVIDGQPGPTFKDFWGNVVFSPDSRHAAYLALRQAGGFLRRSTVVSLVRDGVVGSNWDEVGSNVHFSPDSARTAFSARRGKAWVTVVDDLAGPEFLHTGPPRFSTTGRLGYLAAEPPMGGEARYRIVVEGIDTPTFTEAVSIGDGETFLFTPDGEHVTAGGFVDGLWRPIVDHKVGPGGLGLGAPSFEGDVVSFLMQGEGSAHLVSTRIT